MGSNETTTSIDLRRTTGPVPQTACRCVGAGRAPELLRADLQQHLRTAVEECGFEYIRFHTEWNSSYGARDPIHDSCYNTAYVLEKLKGIGSGVEAMSYWTVSDIFEGVSTGYEHDDAIRPSVHVRLRVLRGQAYSRPRRRPLPPRCNNPHLVSTGSCLVDTHSPKRE